jgi:hypothetical protein
MEKLAIATASWSMEKLAIATASRPGEGESDGEGEEKGEGELAKLDKSG